MKNAKIILNNYDEDDEADMLNSFDIMATFSEEKDGYHVYV